MKRYGEGGEYGMEEGKRIDEKVIRMKYTLQRYPQIQVIFKANVGNWIGQQSIPPLSSKNCILGLW